MNLNEYQEQAFAFAKYKDPLYPFMALGEEAGEVIGKLAKAMRKTGDWRDADPDDVIKELGDALWQLSACAKELGVTLEEVAQRNIDKLSDRQDRGVIVGEGDNR